MAITYPIFTTTSYAKMHREIEAQNTRLKTACSEFIAAYHKQTLTSTEQQSFLEALHATAIKCTDAEAKQELNRLSRSISGWGRAKPEEKEADIGILNRDITFIIRHYAPEKSYSGFEIKQLQKILLTGTKISYPLLELEADISQSAVSQVLHTSSSATSEPAPDAHHVVQPSEMEDFALALVRHIQALENELTDVMVRDAEGDVDIPQMALGVLSRIHMIQTTLDMILALTELVVSPQRLKAFYKWLRIEPCLFALRGHIDFVFNLSEGILKGNEEIAKKIPKLQEVSTALIEKIIHPQAENDDYALALIHSEDNSLKRQLAQSYFAYLSRQDELLNKLPAYRTDHLILALRFTRNADDVTLITQDVELALKTATDNDKINFSTKLSTVVRELSKFENPDIYAKISSNSDSTPDPFASYWLALNAMDKHYADQAKVLSQQALESTSYTSNLNASSTISLTAQSASSDAGDGVELASFDLGSEQYSASSGTHGHHIVKQVSPETVKTILWKLVATALSGDAELAAAEPLINMYIPVLLKTSRQDPDSFNDEKCSAFANAVTDAVRESKRIIMAEGQSGSSSSDHARPSMDAFVSNADRQPYSSSSSSSSTSARPVSLSVLSLPLSSVDGSPLSSLPLVAADAPPPPPPPGPPGPPPPPPPGPPPAVAGGNPQNALMAQLRGGNLRSGLREVEKAANGIDPAGSPKAKVSSSDEQRTTLQAHGKDNKPVTAERLAELLTVGTCDISPQVRALLDNELAQAPAEIMRMNAQLTDLKKQMMTLEKELKDADTQLKSKEIKKDAKDGGTLSEPILERIKELTAQKKALEAEQKNLKFSQAFALPIGELQASCQGVVCSTINDALLNQIKQSGKNTYVLVNGRDLHYVTAADGTCSPKLNITETYITKQKKDADRKDAEQREAREKSEARIRAQKDKAIAQTKNPEEAEQERALEAARRAEQITQQIAKEKKQRADTIRAAEDTLIGILTAKAEEAAKTSAVSGTSIGPVLCPLSKDEVDHFRGKTGHDHIVPELQRLTKDDDKLLALFPRYVKAPSANDLTKELVNLLGMLRDPVDIEKLLRWQSYLDKRDKIDKNPLAAKVAEGEFQDKTILEVAVILGDFTVLKFLTMQANFKTAVNMEVVETKTKSNGKTVSKTVIDHTILHTAAACEEAEGPDSPTRYSYLRGLGRDSGINTLTPNRHGKTAAQVWAERHPHAVQQSDESTDHSKPAAEQGGASPWGGVLRRSAAQRKQEEPTSSSNTAGPTSLPTLRPVSQIGQTGPSVGQTDNAASPFPVKLRPTAQGGGQPSTPSNSPSPSAQPIDLRSTLRRTQSALSAVPSPLASDSATKDKEEGKPASPPQIPLSLSTLADAQSHSGAALRGRGASPAGEQAPGRARPTPPPKRSDLSASADAPVDSGSVGRARPLPVPTAGIGTPPSRGVPPVRGQAPGRVRPVPPPNRPGSLALADAPADSSSVDRARPLPAPIGQVSGTGTPSSCGAPPVRGSGPGPGRARGQDLQRLGSSPAILPTQPDALSGHPNALFVQIPLPSTTSAPAVREPGRGRPPISAPPKAPPKPLGLSLSRGVQPGSDTSMPALASPTPVSPIPVPSVPSESLSTSPNSTLFGGTPALGEATTVAPSVTPSSSVATTPSAAASVMTPLEPSVAGQGQAPDMPNEAQSTAVPSERPKSPPCCVM